MHGTRLIDDNITALTALGHTATGLSDSEYARAAEAVFCGSVGKHLRHVLDHFSQCLDGLAAGTIDYDARDRDGATETCAAEGQRQIERVTRSLTTLKARCAREPALLSQSLTVHYRTSPELTVGLEVASSLGRELAFLHSHLVHHMALVVVILQGMGIAVDPRAALSPATIRYEDQLV